MDKEAITLAYLSDKLAEAQRENRITYSKFLDMQTRSLAQARLAHVPGARALFYGGYPEAERCLCVFVPVCYAIDSAEALAAYYEEREDISPMLVLRVKKDNFTALSHRDYLGAALGLGVERDMVGDILVREDGCDILLLREVANYLAENLRQAGRATLNTEILPIAQLHMAAKSTMEKQVTVPSLRLDCVLAEAFALSRAAAAEQILAGNTYVNDRQIKKADRRLEPGDKLVLRKKGRVRLKSLVGQTKKGKQKLLLEIF